MNREIILKGNQSLGALSFNDLLATVFGQNNVDTLKQQAQAAATTVALNEAGKYVQQNPDAVKALTSTGQQTVMDTLAQVWDQYRLPIIIAGVIAGGALAYGIYSMMQVNKLTKSGAIRGGVKKRANPSISTQVEDEDEE